MVVRHERHVPHMATPLPPVHTHKVGLGERAELSDASLGLPFENRDLKERTRFDPNPSPLLGSVAVTVRAESRLPERRML